MARTEEAVHIGAGYMYVAPYVAGVAPTYTPLTAAMVVTDAPAGTWADVGYSEDGWNFVVENEYGFWTPAELVDPIATVKNSQEIHWRGTAAQFSLETIAIALGGGTVSITSAGTPGSADAIHKYLPPGSTSFDYFSVVFRVEAEGTNLGTSLSRVRDFYVPKCISIASVDTPHTKGANPSLVAIDLQAVKPSGDIFTIYEQAEPA